MKKERSGVELRKKENRRRRRGRGAGERLEKEKTLKEIRCGGKRSKKEQNGRLKLMEVGLRSYLIRGTLGKEVIEINGLYEWDGKERMRGRLANS